MMKTYDIVNELVSDCEIDDICPLNETPDGLLVGDLLRVGLGNRVGVEGSEEGAIDVSPAFTSSNAGDCVGAGEGSNVVNIDGCAVGAAEGDLVVISTVAAKEGALVGAHEGASVTTIEVREGATVICDEGWDDGDGDVITIELMDGGIEGNAVVITTEGAIDGC